METRNIRLVQASVITMVGLYALMVFLGNVLDYNSNYEYVKHVLSMDTTFEGNALMWRAITDSTLHTLAYWGIILVEAAIAALALFSGAKMFLSLKAKPAVFTAAKSFGIYALLLSFLLWFVGFIVIGTEWFAMWQSEIWNGKETAMALVAVFGIFTIISLLPDRSTTKLS